MIVIKNPHEIESMKRAGRAAAAALEAAKVCVETGIPGKLTTADVDRAVSKAIRAAGAKATFLGYGGYPACACVSVNEQVIHGIPGPRVLNDGDLVSVDVGATLDGFVGDCAATFFIGNAPENARKLAKVTRESFYAGLRYARVGYRLSDVSHAIQEYAESYGYGVVRDFVGHGVGRKMHEEPEVPNFGRPGHGPRLTPGMTIAIEPMINEGTWKVEQKPDGWTVVTADGKLSAHYENTVLITKGEPVLLTRNVMDI